ncbi:MAG: hypothetical protein KatS3mg090_0553 [Patescibacteria group bacterium]|nr:MAG: hypothetical protein KatS3mg090_0553 [Patescibacteria group bacterium]
MPKVFKYCPICGNKLQKKDLGVLQCVSCSFRLYPNPKPTTAIMIRNEKGEILLVERAVEPKKGLLDLLGGFIEYDETAEESACREISE